MIKFNTLGKIEKGHDQGWYIFIEPIKDEKTQQDTGSYLLLISSSPDLQSKATEVYDYWMEDFEHLKEQMNYFGWQISWTE